MLNERHEIMGEKRWWKLEKFFQGGKIVFQVEMPLGFSAERWKYAMEFFGENTNGGHCYGYSVYRHRLKAKHKKLPVFNIPAENF
jgi:hypothetical protein